MAAAQPIPAAVVLDTSVVVGWVFNETEKAPWAQRIMERVGTGELVAHVPELFWAEFQQVAGRKCQGDHPQTTRAQAEQAYQDVLALPLKEVAVLVDLREVAWRRRLDLHVGSYDAYFLALAQDLGIEYWTFDESFCQSVSADPSVRAIVKLVGVDVQP